jgi:transposase
LQLEVVMDVLHARCAGLDVHRDSLVACARLVTAEGTAYEIATFGTMAADLDRLAAWLAARGVTQVAMEATGVYWKPVWAALAAKVELILANAAHVKNVPGRKTDVNDATWLADLLAHGLIRASFVPAPPVQALRDLTRTRRQLTREKVAHAQRIDKLLQAANLRLGTVLADILGASGRAILAALAAGETDPERLADRVQTRIRASRQQVIEALRGRLAEHQRQLLQIHLDQIAAIERALGALDAALDRSLDPFQEAAGRLTTIPGVGALAAAGILAEIGCDMSRFATPAHLISWAGLCPANDESAGKRRSTRLRKGAPWLKTLLVQVAWSAARARAGYLPALFARLRARRGPKKAIIAVAASILTAVYWMLRRGTSYQDLGTDYFERTDRQRLATKLVRKLDRLGFNVTLAQRQTT